MTSLTAIVLTYNEAEHIADCIASLQFADHIIVFDSGSTDDTRQVATNLGASVIQHPFENYASQRNAALDVVQAGWVLFVDADERASPALADEIQRVLRSAGACTGFRIPRVNYIFGKPMRATGWYPDYQTRLLQVGAAHYDPEKIVHEVVVLAGELGTLEQPLIHYNYRDLVQFADKQQRYSRYDAEILYQQGERVKPWTLLTMPVRHFLWRFWILKGYRDGWQGLLLSALMARYEFRKYRLLGRLWQGGTQGKL